MVNLLPPNSILKRLIGDGKLPGNASAILDLVQQNASLDEIKLATTHEDLFNLGNIVEKHAKNVKSQPGLFVARSIFRLSASLGNLNGKFKYANALFECKFTEFTPNESIKMGQSILKELVLLNHPGALYAMALNSIAKKNTSDAYYYMKRSADLGFPLANFQVGNWYRTGEIKGVDNLKAFKYIEKAHESGIPEATFLLAGFYQSGVGIPSGVPDLPKTQQLYIEAAKSGLSVAQHNVGVTYLEGAASDPEIAVEYFKMAANKGFQISILNLAQIYATGNGKVTIDYRLAREFLGMTKNLNESEQRKANEIRLFLDSLPDGVPQTNTRVKYKSCLIL